MPRLRYIIPFAAASVLVGSMLRPAYASLDTREWTPRSSSSSSSVAQQWYPTVIDPNASSSSSVSSQKSGSGSTGSGVVIDPLVAVWNKYDRDRAKRITDFRQQFLLFKKKERPYTEGIVAFYLKRTQLRQQCRVDLRKASRDEKTLVEFRCYRAELAFYSDYLRRQYDYYSELPGVTPRIRREILEPQKLLGDAVGAIMYAIDSGVYVSGNELLEAKKNLREKFQIPSWDALARARIDRDITWVGYLLHQVDTAASEELAELGSVRPLWKLARPCFMDVELRLRTLLDGSAQARMELFAGLQSEIRICLQGVPPLSLPPAGSGSLLPSSSGSAVSSEGMGQN